MQEMNAEIIAVLPLGITQDMGGGGAIAGHTPVFHGIVFFGKY